MKVNKEQWHVKWYLQCDKVWNIWLDKDYLYKAPKRTDVCIYIRTSVLYPLITGIATLFTATAGYWALFGYAVSTIGLLPYLIFAGIIVAAVLFVRSDKAEEIFESQADRVEKCVETKVGWFKLLKQWIIDKHDKVCTLIEVVENND